MIDEAAARDAIHPAMLMMLGRLLAGAQIEIGEPARAALGRALDLGALEGSAADAYEALLRPALSQSESDPFELYEEVEALISIFPIAYRSAFVERMVVEFPCAHPPERGWFPSPSRRGRRGSGHSRPWRRAERPR